MKRKNVAFALGASISASVSLSAAVSSEKYVYDASGNVVERQIGEAVTSFGYSDHLLKDCLSDNTQKKYQYDDSGRLIGEIEEGQVIRKLDYQFADKVIKVRNIEETSEFYYNAEGQLVATKNSGNLETFSWDGLAMLSRGRLAYTNEVHVSGGVPVLIGNSVTVSDFVGTTMSIGKKSLKGTAFGEGLEEGLFTGKPFSTELNGFVFKHRNYSADTASWMVRDPLGYPDGLNNYAYVQGDPINNLDPEGTLTAVGFPKTAAPPKVTDVCGTTNASVEIKATPMTTSDFRSTLASLITTRNATLHTANRLTPSQVGPEAGVLLPTGWMATIWKPGLMGGAEASVSATYNTGLSGQKFHSWVQAVYTNAPLKNKPANQSFLDASMILYTGGIATATNFHDGPSRVYSWLKSCNGTLNKVSWVGNANAVIVNPANKTVELPKDAGFKYTWTMAEK